MAEGFLEKNWVNFLAQSIKANGCTKPVVTTEDVLANLYYLSKEDSRGSRYIPLQYKRVLEKLILGFTNSILKYEDGKDVYFETLAGTQICTANVYWVQYQPDGSERVLGHGIHSLSLKEVLPNVFMSDEERASKWKSTVIGGAKSRALYDGGIGLEFYGDVFTPEENVDENDEQPAKETKAEEKEVIKGDTEKSADPLANLPAPKPRRKAKAATAPVVEPAAETVNTTEATAEPEMALESAKRVISDAGNFKGQSLGDIYGSMPKNIIWLSQNGGEMVKKAAKSIIASDPDLAAIAQ